MQDLSNSDFEDIKQSGYHQGFDRGLLSDQGSKEEGTVQRKGFSC